MREPTQSAVRRQVSLDCTHLFDWAELDKDKLEILGVATINVSYVVISPAVSLWAYLVVECAGGFANS